MPWYLRMLILSIILTGMLISPFNSIAQDTSPVVLVISTSGPVTPAMAEYLRRGIRTAENRGAEALIVQLDTPGGGVETMNDMVQYIRASRVPVVIYIAPQGAIAGSAGTVITLAGHAAAMAPETAIGAASPVGPEGEDLGQTMEAKMKNILKATARSLAERRGEEAAKLAEETIESAEAVSASQALDAGLVDFIATDMGDLFDQLDGFTVEVQGKPRQLNTRGALMEPLPISFIEQLLGILTNPNFVFLLLTLGVQAIIIEIYSPGGWVAGFIGVVCLALAAYGLGVLPVNWFGLVFLVTAFVLFILDIKAPTHGALTVAGTGSLIVGALVLFNSPGVPSFQRVSVPFVIGASVITGGSFFALLLFALRALKQPIRTGQESLAGKIGTARSEIAPTGTVQVGGELWSAELSPGEASIPSGTRVTVQQVQGVHVIVKRSEEAG